MGHTWCLPKTPQARPRRQRSEERLPPGEFEKSNPGGSCEVSPGGLEAIKEILKGRRRARGGNTLLGLDKQNERVYNENRNENKEMDKKTQKAIRNRVIVMAWEEMKNEITMQDLARALKISLATFHRVVKRNTKCEKEE